jgi:hypothetical protein
MNETHATVIKKLGIPFYSVIITDFEYMEVLETLGYFTQAEEAETFAVLWNHMLTDDDIGEYLKRDFKEE